MWHFLSLGSMLSFIIFLLSVILIIIKKKVNKRLWCVLCFIPLAISIIHFIVYFVPNDFIIRNFLFMYIFSILFLVLPFIYNKEKIFKISSIIIIILGFISFFMTFYNTIMVENIHNLNYYSYTDSFNKTISILKKEYVLNEHKKIDYDKLYSKYYPLIEQAENENNEQLYYKTMFEFSRNFKDGHFKFEIYYTTLEETIRRLDFANDYYNKDYGFGSVLLSDGNIVAILVDENSEAYNKGLRDGMIITKKDNIDIHKVLDEIITNIGACPVLEDERLLNSFYLFGQGNDEINVSFLNEENEEITITIRATDNTTSKLDELYWKIMYQDYDLENLDTKMLDSNTGYIYVSNEMYSPFKGAVGYLFDDSSYLTKVVDEKLQNLINQGMTDLIIDLRANSGGYLTESEAIASLFTNDSYLVLKDAKYFSNLYDKSYLRGNGKYSNMKITVLVNSDTASAGDCLAYLLSKNPNVRLVGFTNSNNSAQSVGGVIFLSGGTSLIKYPIYKSYGNDDKIFIDTDFTGMANIKLDYIINITKENIKDIFYSDENYDYALNYAIQLMN